VDSRAGAAIPGPRYPSFMLPFNIPVDYLAS
jgi:hypothetical protein